MNKYITIPVVALGILASCNDDKGSYTYTPINEATISNIESTYNAIQGITELEIDPTVKGDIYDKDLSNYEFTWHVCESTISEEQHKHTVISTDRVLKWTVDQPVGSYALYFTVKDKASGIEKSVYSTLRVASPFSRGFILLGTNGNDDIALVDMLSMPASGDTAIVENALVSDPSITKPRTIQYTGSYSRSPQESMWLFGETDSWRLNSVPAENFPEFDVIGTFSELSFADNEYGITNERAVGFFPTRALGGMNINRSYRGYITEKCIYGPNGITRGEYYGVPTNRMEDNMTAPLFNFYPKVFYSGSITSFYPTTTPLIVYNTDDDIFVMINATFTRAGSCSSITDYSYAGWRWDCRSEDRKLVWGDNTIGPQGYCVFVMKNLSKDNAYEVYSLKIASKYSQTKERFPVDLAIATDFDKATIYSAIGCRRAIFYAVGSVLHQYDFERKQHIQMDLGDEITMIKPEPFSLRRSNDIMVATWSPTNKGTFMKIEVGDNPNTLEMAIRNDIQDADNPNPEHDRYLEKWSTRLKIVDAEWRTR